MSFASLDLSDFLLRSLETLGYAEPTPIQAASIPVILAGKDLLAAAQTGSGKTAAFSLPIAQKVSLSGEQARKPRHLILVPTRELAVQVGAALERYAEGSPVPIRVLVAFGGVGYDAQMKAAHAGVDVVVATPGRLIDLVEQRSVELDEVELLVLDEADRLLALGFADELNAIIKTLPAKRQNLLFSATFPQHVVSLADSLLNDPEKIQLEAASQPVQSIQQRAIEVDGNRRTGLLRHLLEVEGWERVLVFVGSKRRADNVTVKLTKNGIKALALHGDMSQDKRQRSLERFKQNKVRVLMATDVAARGIDIAGLPCVVNYDLPRAAADYVHRIGRTGRAGGEGVAVSFITDDMDGHFRQIEKKNKIDPILRERLEGFEPENWNPEDPNKGKVPVKGKRPNKKDKLRKLAAGKGRGSGGVKDVSSPWARALRKSKGD
ncbi:DEAD/DEAH box helicase [Pelagicoccus sp. SDUM812002]|uniref:DEAD/DEAH box helicase n=1 Tax=Pelagicoccus sp. SDUM812002 TaxID=3041266 RepID=UPI00280F3BD4|nr:DEAD/DEAH box helicase [Pelagicoccus sp. SDUM812002]MDQ8185003.1 DEAD/DEAH box helicase [Pelagicoccus sp. SDUM812002]